MQCPLDTFGIARDDGEEGFSRLVRLRAALFPIPPSSSVKCLEWVERTTAEILRYVTKNPVPPAEPPYITSASRTPGPCFA
jgi:hypothetical protein